MRLSGYKTEILTRGSALSGGLGDYEMTAFLSDYELLKLCEPLTQPAAMVRYLKDQGFFVKRRPNGWPLISRTNFEAVMMGSAPSAAGGKATPGPNAQALLDRFKNNGAIYGNGAN